MKIKIWNTANVPMAKDGKPLPHLGVIIDASGEAVPIYPGMVVLQIMDPTRGDGVEPWVLVKVTRAGWYFRCACDKQGCDRAMRMRPEIGGRHIFAQGGEGARQPGQHKGQSPPPTPGQPSGDETPEE